MTPESQARRFFEAMFPKWLFDDGHKLAIWTFPNKRTRWAATIDEAVEMAVSSPANQNVYFSLGLIKKPPNRGRGKEADVSAITSLYVDIDINDGKVERGKGDKLPKDKKGAKAILEELKLQPSFLIFSGHGYQAYWILTEPLIIETTEDRVEAKTLSKQWNRTAQLCAHHLGFTVDSTFDLSRVFRVPGTENIKGEHHVQCVIAEPEENVKKIRKFDEKEIETYIAPEYLTLDGGAYAATNVIEPASPVLPRESHGIPTMVSAFIENDSNFKKTWDRKRADFVDQSPSSYDMSIANQLVKAGAEDQVIADAIFHWRVKHKVDVDKARRRDYIMRTISKARTEARSDSAVSNLLDMSHSMEVKDVKSEQVETAEDRNKREKILAEVSKSLGVPVSKVIKHGEENSIYSIVLDNNIDIKIGTMKCLLNQDIVRAQIADRTTVVMKMFKKPTWHSVAQVILRAAVLIDNDEVSREGWMRKYLNQYLTQGSATLYREDDWQAALFNHDPYIREDCLHITIDSLSQFLKTSYSDRVNRGDIFDSLRLLGFSYKDVTARHRGERITRGYWFAPIDSLDRLNLPESVTRKPDEPEKECHPL